MFRKLFLAFVLVSAFVPLASACPLCRDSVTNGGDPDDDASREARAYNTSIYLMAGVPYSLLGVGGIASYRMYRSSRRCRTPEV